MPRYRQHEKTGAMLLIEAHYKSVGLSEGWTWLKLEELAGLMQVLPFELLALIGVTPADSTRYYRANKIPTVAALHLYLMREWHLNRTLGKQIEPVIPTNLL